MEERVNPLEEEDRDEEDYDDREDYDDDRYENSVRRWANKKSSTLKGNEENIPLVSKDIHNISETTFLTNFLNSELRIENQKEGKIIFPESSSDIEFGYNSKREFSARIIGTDKWTKIKNKDNSITKRINREIKEELGLSKDEIYERTISRLDEISGDESKLRVEIDEKENVKENIRKNMEGLQNKNKTLEIQLRNAEERLDEYNNENMRLKEELRKNPTLEGGQEELKNLYDHIKNKQKHLSSLEKDVKENREIFIEKEEELVKVEEELNKKNDELEKINIKEKEESSKLSPLEKVKYYFKKYGVTAFSISIAVGTIISVIVKNVKSVGKSVGKGFKAVAKEAVKILPGMIGAIASFIFKAAGDAIGFLAKNSWLLIFFIVTYAVEQFNSRDSDTKKSK